MSNKVASMQERKDENTFAQLFMKYGPIWFLDKMISVYMGIAEDDTGEIDCCEQTSAAARAVFLKASRHMFTDGTTPL